MGQDQALVTENDAEFISAAPAPSVSHAAGSHSGRTQRSAERGGPPGLFASFAPSREPNQPARFRGLCGRSGAGSLFTRRREGPRRARRGSGILAPSKPATRQAAFGRFQGPRRPVMVTSHQSGGAARRSGMTLVPTPPETIIVLPPSS